MVRFLGLVCVFAVIGVLQADTHHDGQKKILGKGDGTHQLHKGKNGHTAHAAVRNGKVTGVTAKHKNKDLRVTKYKSKRKQHARADSDDTVHFLVAEAQATATVWVGFGFINQVTNQLMIFWFPINVVDGGDSGATDYDS